MTAERTGARSPRAGKDRFWRGVSRRTRPLLAVAGAACVACCAGPLLAILGGLTAAGLAGTLVVGVGGLFVAGLAAVGLLVVRPRRRACQVPDPQPVAVAAPVRRGS